MTATRSLSASVQDFGRTLLAADAGCPDAELVRRFAERRDESAFAALVQRHGAAVFGVCRRVLRHEQDAEDAFQAAFVVLARKAASVGRAGAVGNWLYGVAYNVARKAKAARCRRELKEREAAARQRLDYEGSVPDDWRELLDVELYALPEKYRAAIVLCDLMGMTTVAAAAEVGCPAKTLGTRLSRGRSLLAARLSRRGVALPACGLALALAECATAAPPRLIGPAVHAALGFASGSLAAVSPTVAALTEGNVIMLKSPKVIALAACVVLAMGGLTYHAAAPGKVKPTAVARSASEAAPAARKAAPKAGFLDHVHGFFFHIFAHIRAAHGNLEADDKAKDKKALTGVWVKKDAELKLDFTDKDALKIYPHGENEVIIVKCEYTVGKDGLVKAKVTELDGKEDAKEKVKEKIPVGLEFSFQWKVKDRAATLSEVKCDKSDLLKSHLEGDYAEKK